MDLVEQQAQALSNAISEVEDTFNWDKAMHPGGCDDYEHYNTAAGALVEPYFKQMKGCIDAEEKLFEQCENDPDNWVSFIQSCCGDKWGDFAKVVAEHGY